MPDYPMKETLIARARHMRRHMTKEELHLWLDGLQPSPYHFRKQHVEAPFITDFCCKRARLIIELDGSGHYTDFGKSYDAWRSGKLEMQGYSVLRFTNADIHNHFDEVCAMIYYIVEMRIRELEGEF